MACIRGWVEFPGGSAVENLPANAGNTGDSDFIPGSGRPPGGGHGNPLQYFAWEIPRTEVPCGLQSMGSQKVRQDLVTEHMEGGWSLFTSSWVKYGSYSLQLMVHEVGMGRSRRYTGELQSHRMFLLSHLRDLGDRNHYRKTWKHSLGADEIRTRSRSHGRNLLEAFSVAFFA